MEEARISYRQLGADEVRRLGLTVSGNAPTPLKGRKVPEVAVDLEAGDLRERAVPLRQADTRARLHCAEGRFGWLESGGGGQLFNPEAILVKFRADDTVRVLRVPPLREGEALTALRRRGDVEFAELDTIQARQWTPNDPLVNNQWHHAVVGSYPAWEFGTDAQAVRIAIVDTPFQMNHPDLAAHADPGWDVVDELPIFSSPGIDHSTLGAGMAAAVIGNGLGIAGASNCRVLPINILGSLGEMGQAVYWAADHGVRIVNISWTGAFSDTLNAAGHYLKTNAHGILVMAGVNEPRNPPYPNQPDIYCVSMTDAADNMVSWAGDHIDFAAPGWNIHSTTTNGGYAFGSGTSYAAPLFCGMAARLMSVNPTLTADEIIELFKVSAVDLGAAGWDRFFGWGRVDYAEGVVAARTTLPAITGIRWLNGEVFVSAPFQPGRQYELWRSSQVAPATWAQVTNASVSIEDSVVTLKDPFPVIGVGFYRVRSVAP